MLDSGDPDAPAGLLASADADVFPRNHPERADLIEGSIGELSPFHETFGYYAQAAGREKDRDYVRTAVRARLVERGVLLERLEKTPLDTERRRSLRAQIDADFTGA